jgi:phosphoribosylformylglycinamidine (FGAM) synthase PurS component
MKARICVTLRTESAEEARKTLRTICEGLVASGSIADYSFEIETDRGVVTEKCILPEGGVIV